MTTPGKPEARQLPADAAAFLKNAADSGQQFVAGATASQMGERIAAEENSRPVPQEMSNDAQTGARS